MNTIEILSLLQQVIAFCLLAYGLLAISNYTYLAIASAFFLRKYKQNSSFIDYDAILRSPIAPAISLIAPAHNEGKTIIENVRSLMSLRYTNYEVILVNDGSTDDSFEQLIKQYELEKLDVAYEGIIQTKEIRGIYKSKNEAFRKLTVVDKENGGKSDALNAGINISAHDLIACVDVDCIMVGDALLKMVKPFIDSKEMIASGGFMGIANSCEIKDGMIEKVDVPKKYLARAQLLEYIRSFLLSRVVWAKLDGMMLISGAFGLFDKKTVIAIGGYDTHTVGEDMEMVINMRRYKKGLREPYKVSYIPDPICWTEAPETLNVLSRQRSRWTRGMIETLWKHRKVMFNPNHPKMGFIGYPYWLLFEWLEPFVEFFGLLLFLFVAFLGFTNWSFFITLMALIYSFVVMYALFALLAEELMYHQYNKREHIRKLFLTSLIEPFFFHPINVYYALRGNFEKWIGVTRWGKMTRTGFTHAKKTE